MPPGYKVTPDAGGSVGHQGTQEFVLGESVPRTGCVAGVFDLFHVGHIDVLERARKVCDRLVVAVLSDEWALDAWGGRPFVPLLERAQILEHLRCVDEVVAVDGVQPGWLTEVLGAQTVFAATGLDGVLGVGELSGIPAELITVLPAGRGSRSTILRAAIDQRQSRSSVA
ncbi:cytidyltransferase-like protein [Kribbella jejuensis]|uniref:Cytidyltransferase-like protein n=1 Tax=Kribbella jejuensis TaxID=236068 RepID=A0A542DAN8_9ACTN|nr:cytidyltransferase-like protein [Kribbella jejuensis]